MANELQKLFADFSRRHEAMDPDRLFADLDGLNLSAPGGHWQIQVFRILDEAGRRWVQVGLRSADGDSQRMLTLRLSPRDGLQHALFSLSSWLTRPEQPCTNILNAA